MYIKTELYNKIIESMPISCVDLLIYSQNKCLLLKRNNNPAKGKYWFPGGRIHKMETIESACLRISKSECNLDCRFIKQICVEETIFLKEDNMVTDKHTLNICCLLHVDDMSMLTIDDYHSDFLWIDEIIESLHESVKRPLMMLGFK
jgi:colanic acid biosynthesis protein WcaH